MKLRKVARTHSHHSGIFPIGEPSHMLAVSTEVKVAEVVGVGGVDGRKRDGRS